MKAGVRDGALLLCLGGAIGGLVVVLGWLVDGAAEGFARHPGLVWLMPVAGFASYGLYRALRLEFSWGTARVIKAAGAGEAVPVALAPAILASTALTVIAGGSVGKEAAALQMGGGLGSASARWASDRLRALVAPAAMAAALGAMLSVPAAGVVFVFEVLRRVPRSALEVLAPVVTSLVAWGVTELAGIRFCDGVALVVPAAFPAASLAALSLAVGGVAGLLALAFCGALGAVRRGLAALGAPVFALAVGGVATALLLGYADLLHYEELRLFCGTGAVQIQDALAGNAVPWWAFAAKAFLTILTLAGGFKGGEIMPVLAVGACAGTSIALGGGLLFDMDATALQPLMAVVAMAAFFAGCTNCPLSAVVLVVELFGEAVLPWVLLACAAAYAIARSVSLYPTSLLRR